MSGIDTHVYNVVVQLGKSQDHKASIKFEKCDLSSVPCKGQTVGGK